MKPLAVVEVLMRYDVPLIAVAREENVHPHALAQMYICLNIEESDDLADKFLIARISHKEMVRYLQEEIDLRYLLKTKGAKYYIVNMIGEVGTIFKPKPFSDPIEEYLPDPALFLRNYKGDLLKSYQISPSGERRVLIDGRWGLPDMRRFSSLFGNAYSFLFALQNDGGTNSQRTKVLFNKYPWRGGFSAVNFFDQLEQLVPRAIRPEIDRMQKASPGFIDFRLDVVIADRVINLVAQLNNKNNAPALAYKETHQFLKQRKWLGSSAGDIRLTDADLSDLTSYVALMSSSLQLEEHTEYIMQLAQSDPLAAVKILLSLFRKVKELADYLATGKAQFSSMSSKEVHQIDGPQH
jgi:hypothetical protein